MRCYTIFRNISRESSNNFIKIIVNNVDRARFWRWPVLIIGENDILSDQTCCAMNKRNHNNAHSYFNVTK